MAWDKPVWGEIDFSRPGTGLECFCHVLAGECAVATSWFGFAGVDGSFRLDLGLRGEPVTVVAVTTFTSLEAIQYWLDGLRGAMADGTVAELTALGKTRTNVSIVAVRTGEFRAAYGPGDIIGVVEVSVTFQDHATE